MITFLVILLLATYFAGVCAIYSSASYIDGWAEHVYVWCYPITVWLVLIASAVAGAVKEINDLF